MEKYRDIIEKIKAIPRPEDYFDREKRVKEERLAVGHDIEKFREISKREEEQNAAEKFNIARKKVLDHNARIALVLENFPIIIEVLNKYAGKRVGEKTKEKIYDELMERTGVAVHFRDEYSRAYITIYHRNNYLVNNEIVIYGKKSGDPAYLMYDSDGKLRHISEDMFNYDRSDKYIEDVDGFIREKIKELEEVNAAIKEVRKKISDYDSDLPDGFAQINYITLSENNRLF